MIALAAAGAAAKTVAKHNPSMSPTATAVLFIVAFIADYLSIGPAWLQTRLVFAAVVTAVHVGFNDSPLDKWTVDNATNVIQAGLDSAHGAYIAAASANVIVGCLVGILSIWTIGCMLPLKSSKKLGRFATLQFKESGVRKMTGMVWALAIPLGLLGDMPAGWIGALTNGCLSLYSWVCSPLPSLIFGAS